MSDRRRGVRPSAEIKLIIDLTAEPIQGLLRHRHGADVPFVGWIALIRALELALQDALPHDDSPGSG